MKYIALVTTFGISLVKFGKKKKKKKKLDSPHVKNRVVPVNYYRGGLAINFSHEVQ
jgi:hypothetical protein